jgi:hypothetical protein
MWQSCCRGLNGNTTSRRFAVTVSSTTDRATFTGNGVATVFHLPFRFFANSDIQAGLVDDVTFAITPKVLGVDYSLVGAGLPEVDGNPASVLTMFVPPPVGKSLFVRRVMPTTQPTDIVNQGRFLPEIHETVFDRLTMLIQQAALSQSRVIRVPEFDPVPLALPSVSGRAAKVFGFDEQGDPIVSNLSLADIEQQPALALASAQAAEESAVEAAASEDGANSFAELSELWATQAEDVPVQPGLFSAFHWARKALASATAAAATLANAVLKTGAQTMAGPLTVTGGITSIPFNKEFVSAQQTIVPGGAISVAHSLGAKPKIVVAYLVCTIATGNFSVGDETFVNLDYEQNNASLNLYGYTCKRDAANIIVRIAQTGFFLQDPVTFALINSATVASNFKIVFQAWA